MLEPPALAADALRAALGDGYHLAAREISFLPLGYDSAAAVYRVQAEDGKYFLKYRRDAVNEAGLAVPRFLHEQGVGAVVPPLRTVTGGLWHGCEAGALIVYPFLHDAHPLPSGQAFDLWRQFGATLRRVHEAALPPALAALLARETFEPAGLALVKRLDSAIGAQRWPSGPAQVVADAWGAHRGQIHALTVRAEALGRRLRAAPPGPLRLCHADPHWDNVLVDAEHRLWLVDWDEALLAAPERDLMFVIGGLSDDWATPADTARFFEGYGPVEVDAAALAYHRADWALQDIGEFARQALEDAEAGAATRADAARLFQGLFGRGAIVEKALGSSF